MEPKSINLFLLNRYFKQPLFKSSFCRTGKIASKGWNTFCACKRPGFYPLHHMVPRALPGAIPEHRLRVAPGYRQIWPPNKANTPKQTKINIYGIIYIPWYLSGSSCSQIYSNLKSTHTVLETKLHPNILYFVIVQFDFHLYYRFF